ncbi:MAG: DNA polymerase III subunit gamma/tau [Patescibacteria group bacterium]
MPEIIALYRKYRPRKFSEVIGQDHIVEALSQAVKGAGFAHAYLFIGSRGTGKTSVARILARELGTKPEDLYEIDGASNRGIDEIRELRDAVTTLPFSSPKKVYIIDEVHMLTKEAFNALLKTLEEPPSHVIFILATTEGHRVPETIISRCQTFNFKKPSINDLVKAILKIAKAENWQVETEAVELLAILGDGSYRDAVGMLQKVTTALADKKLTAEEVARLTGAPGLHLARSLVASLGESNLESALRVIAEVNEHNYDAKVFLKMVLRLTRLVMIINLAPKLAPNFLQGLSDDEVKFLKEMASKPGASAFSKTLRELLVAYDDLGRAYLPTAPIELAIIKLLGEARG